MNTRLTEAMVEHIYQSFAVISSEFIGGITRSLISPGYLLNDKLHFQSGEDTESKKVWGCQMNMMGKDFKVLLGDCGEQYQEFAMIVCAKDLPTWGMYLVIDTDDPLIDKEAMIACSVSDDAWMQASTFLQASFLAGMEQLRDTGLPWDKIVSHKEEFPKLLSFIKFHSATLEDADARQKEGS